MDRASGDRVGGGKTGTMAVAMAVTGVLRRKTRRTGMALALAGALVTLTGCVGSGVLRGEESPVAAAQPSHMDITLIGFNDLHGNLEPPQLAVSVPGAQGAVAVPAGGLAYLASAVAQLKARGPHHAVVSAGDLVGASPLVSSLFLDEPTIEAVNQIGLDFNAVGNHEFDRGASELLRLQHGGCEKFTPRAPCQVSRPFAGAQFGFLAANVTGPSGATVLPPTGLKRFTQGDTTITLGFIGITLRATPTMVMSAGVAGLEFADEAITANALVPQLRAAGADVIVLVIHEGGRTGVGATEASCAGLSGDIVPILERLDPAIDVVVSGHTHQAYVCDYARVNPAKPFLLTSAGHYGTLVTDIQLRVDTATRRVVHKVARNLVVQSQPFTGARGLVPLQAAVPAFAADPEVQHIIERYLRVAQQHAERAVGSASAAVRRQPAASLESALGNLIADVQLAATRAPAQGGAQLSFMNAGGLRSDLVPQPDGVVRFGQLFSIQPFANQLVVKTLTGAQLHEVLEQQFASGSNSPQRPRVLSVSEGFQYQYDLTMPRGQRVRGMVLHGARVLPTTRVRVVMSSYLDGGGDNFEALTRGEDRQVQMLDIDALEAYFRSHSPVAAPDTQRITRIGRVAP